MVTDEAPVAAEIWNVLGLRIYKGALEFKAKSATIKMNDLAPGNYLLRLSDSRAKYYTIKFTVL